MPTTLTLLFCSSFSRENGRLLLICSVSRRAKMNGIRPSRCYRHMLCHREGRTQIMKDFHGNNSAFPSNSRTHLLQGTPSHPPNTPKQQRYWAPNGQEVKKKSRLVHGTWLPCVIWLGLWAQLLIQSSGQAGFGQAGVFCGSNQWVSSQCCVHLVKWNNMVGNQNTSNMRRKEAIKGTCLQEKTTVYRLYCKSYIGTLEGTTFLTIYPSPVEKLDSMKKQVKPNFPNIYKICGTSRSPATTNMQMDPRITGRNERINILQMHVCWCDHKNSRNQGNMFLFVFSFSLSFFFWCLSLSPGLSPWCWHIDGNPERVSFRATHHCLPARQL